MHALALALDSFGALALSFPFLSLPCPALPCPALTTPSLLGLG